MHGLSAAPLLARMQGAGAPMRPGPRARPAPPRRRRLRAHPKLYRTLNKAVPCRVPRLLELLAEVAGRRTIALVLTEDLQLQCTLARSSAALQPAPPAAPAAQHARHA